MRRIFHIINSMPLPVYAPPDPPAAPPPEPQNKWKCVISMGVIASSSVLA